MAPPPVTSLRGGRFRVVGSLGEGTQGTTLDAVDVREGRPVAIKRFDVRGASAWKDVELAEREARVLQSLSHPKLPRYLDRFEEDGALYLVMEKIDGESLAAIRKRDGGLDEAEVERLLRDAADVLTYLHGRAPPVIHRDLKPGNVIRRPDGSFAFVDFGAVRNKLRPEGGSTVVGTFGFMAPEQFQGRALPASDVYAIGATAISMLTGSEPEALPHKGLALDVRAALAGRASDRMIHVLEKMLEPDPDLRPSAIAPLLVESARRSSSEPGRRSAAPPQPWEAEWRRDFEDQMHRWTSHYESKYGRRQARRDARHARRQERLRRRGLRAVPWPYSMLLGILFPLAIVLVSVATQLVVPLVLTALSVVFGRALREAAETVRESGKTAVGELLRSREWLRTQPPTGAEAAQAASEAPRARVDDEDPSHGRVRIEAESAPEEDGVEDAQHHETPRARTRP